MQLWTGFGVASLIALVLLAPKIEVLTDPEEALLAGLWAIGVATALWFTFSLVLVQFANRSGSRTLRNLSDQIAMPLARRLAQGSLALGMVALPACGSNSDTRPTMVLVESGVSTTSTSTLQPEVTASVIYQAPTSVTGSTSTITPTTGSDSPTEAEMSAEPGTQADTSQPQPGTEPGSHIVTEGENLWSIAKAHITQATGATPSNSEIGPYWARLVEQNRDALSSGNTNLIYPGESIQLPATPARPATSIAQTAAS